MLDSGGDIYNTHILRFICDADNFFMYVLLASERSETLTGITPLKIGDVCWRASVYIYNEEIVNSINK